MKIALLLFFISTFAYSYETKGTYRLNPFPYSEWISVTELSHENIEVDVSSDLTDDANLFEYHNVINQTIAKKVTDSTFIGANFKFFSTTTTQLRYGELETERSSQAGFQEPSFVLYSRRSWARIEGDSVLDFYFSFTPSLMERKVGGDDGNNYVGRNIFEFELNRGSFYKDWDFNLKFNYKLYTKGKEFNAKTDKKSTIEPAGEITGLFEFQHTLLEASYYLRAGVGLRIIEDQTYKNEDGKQSVVQQGTGSLMHIGFVYVASQTETWVFAIQRLKNDYFVKQENTNADGKYIARKFSVTYVKEF